MIRIWEIWVCFAYSVTNPDGLRLPRMILEPPENTQRSLSGVGVYIPLHLPLSHSPTNYASKAFIPSLLSILELDSCKETPRDWEEVRFEVWFESTPWASTCSSQEALEATFDSSIHVCYSWSLAPRRLEVPVSFHSLVVKPRKFVLPRPSWTSTSEQLNLLVRLIEWGRGLYGNPALYEHLNGDVAPLWSELRDKSCVSFIYYCIYCSWANLDLIYLLVAFLLC